MKRNIVVTGRAHDLNVTIKVQIQSKNKLLRDWEVRNKKTKLQNRLHSLLSDFGFDAAEIRISR